MFRYLARRSGPPAAEDLLSEVFITALSASARVIARDSGSALPWLYGITLNVLRAHFRRPPPTAGMATDSGVDGDAAIERLDAAAERGGFAAAERGRLRRPRWPGRLRPRTAAPGGVGGAHPAEAATARRDA